jgi:hypothetical protein
MSLRMPPHSLAPQAMRYEIILHSIAAKKPDILLIQNLYSELGGRSSVFALIEHLLEMDGFVGKRSGPATNAIFIRRPIERLAMEVDNDFQHPVPILHLRVPDFTDPVTVASVQLIDSVDLLLEADRLLEYAKADKFAVLGGDFCWSEAREPGIFEVGQKGDTSGRNPTALDRLAARGVVDVSAGLSVRAAQDTALNLILATDRLAEARLAFQVWKIAGLGSDPVSADFEAGR